MAENKGKRGILGLNKAVLGDYWANEGHFN